ncbi:hypothetical protein B0H14DRAFT_2618485 [Mycena olivaceomarginata]|nr:hypothetical protein B0H14DRAFT_2618485 [Mycena olivaceomarginata]
MAWSEPKTGKRQGWARLGVLKGYLNAFWAKSKLLDVLPDVVWVRLAVGTRDVEAHGGHGTDAEDQIIPNTYNILYLYRRRNGHIRPRVTFTERILNGKAIPPPSSVLLGLHAAYARSAHMSGAAAILDDFDRDIPPTAVLTQGSSDMQADPVAAHDLAYHLAVFELPLSVPSDGIFAVRKLMALGPNDFNQGAQL